MSRADLENFIARPKHYCLGCGRAWLPGTPTHPIPVDSPAYQMCKGCGKIMEIGPDGVLVEITQADRLKIRARPWAEEKRRQQEEIVALLWG